MIPADSQPRPVSALPTPRRFFAMHALACAIALVSPTLATEGRIGLPQFETAGLAGSLLALLAYAVAWLGIGAGGLAFIGRRKPRIAVLMALATLPALTAVAAGARSLFAERAQHFPQEVIAAVLGAVLETALSPASFGLAATACAFLLVASTALLALRAGLARQGLDATIAARPTVGRAVLILFGMAAYQPVSLSLHAGMQGDAIPPPLGALWTAFVLVAGLEAMLVRDVERLRWVGDERERRRMWRQAAAVPLCAALSVFCFDASLVFACLRPANECGRTGASDVFLRLGADAAWVIVLGCVPLWRSRAVALSMSRRSLVAPATAIAVLLGGLLIFDLAVSASENELYRVPSQSNLPVAVAVAKTEFQVLGPGRILGIVALDVFNASPSDLVVAMAERGMSVGGNPVNFGWFGMKTLLPPFRHTMVVVPAPVYTAEDYAVNPSQGAEDYLIYGDLFIRGEGWDGKVHFKASGTLSDETLRGLFATGRQR